MRRIVSGRISGASPESTRKFACPASSFWALWIACPVPRCSACNTKFRARSEEHTSELQSPCNLVCRLLLEKKKSHIRRRLPVASRAIGPLHGTRTAQPARVALVRSCLPPESLFQVCLTPQPADKVALYYSR